MDDEPFNIISLEGILEMQGVSRIEKAFNGEEGLNKFKDIKNIMSRKTC